ncbi:phosphoesterase [Cryobacterium algoritolerans]|uniref:Phosphoesterase n=1 Tax=Cryobacterium algoritolerans TaxID=1259184 RepID=A0A4R8WHM5_9MICO|nr:alkaline phosphatase family protein [Cryobacterium algoritolerans]TFC09888.1 phosphoesterase [Cryobacterium algoritolerans]
MTIKTSTGLVALLTLGLVGGIAAAATAPNVAGPQGDGTALTPVGQRVTPTGRQTNLGDLPLNSALSPDGKTLIVTNNGQGTQSLQVVDVAAGAVVQTIPYASPESLYMGLAWSKDGTKAFASAAANSKIRTYSFAHGVLTEGASLPLPTTTPDGTALNLFPAGLALTGDGTRLVVADQLADAVSIIDLATGAVATTPVGHRPLSVTLAADGLTAYVTNQGAATVSVVSLTSAPIVTGTLEAGLHPNKSVLAPDGGHLYVADGDADAISAIDLAAGTTSSISVSPSKDSPVGSNPTGLALNTDGSKLFVSNSGNNDVAIIDLGSQTVDGVVPVGWYPTSLSFADGRLHTTNAKGLGAGPNNGAGHPDPESSAATAENQYSGSMITGTLSSFEIPVGGDLQRATRQVASNNRSAEAEGEVIPRKPGQDSPIKHVIYVVKENRTYDQVLGSLGRGNGDPALNLFGDESAPNMRALSKQFTTIDNFYADAEVSANGWNWVASANSNPYAEQMWPANYSGRKAPYPSENATPEIAAQEPDNTYVWQRLAQAGVSFRNYGFFVGLAGGKAVSQDPVLDAQTDHDYRGYDLSCPDSAGTFAPLKTDCGSPRIDEWSRDFAANVAADTVPTVQFVRLPNDHTQATRVSKPTPKAYVADNDFALGQLVDTVSHSRIWGDTAIFVTEDDAQNGPDHVDAHRTVALAISPYTQTGKVDSTYYSTASMVHTIGLLAGIQPMTQFDAFATPMSASFTSTAVNKPYSAIRPSYDMTTINAANAPLAGKVAGQNTDTEDKIDEQLYNRAIWQSVNGAGSAMPQPKHDVIGSGTAAGTDDDNN